MKRRIYTDGQNPFMEGTARFAKTEKKAEKVEKLTVRPSGSTTAEKKAAADRAQQGGEAREHKPRRHRPRHRPRHKSGSSGGSQGSAE